MNVLTLFFLLLPQPAPAERVMVAARATIKASGFCFLITVDSDGQPQARLMDPFTPEDDMTVWMGTNRNTRKVDRKSTRLNSSHIQKSRMPSSA